MSEPAIDVIVRTGRRPAALLERAVRSLARQSAGAIRVLLVRHGPADAGALCKVIGGALRGIVVIDAPGANRGRAMAAGLVRVTAPRFAFLDDDDYLLEDHFLHLLEAAYGVPGPAFAYCDILAEDEGAPEGTGLRLFREGPAQPPLGHITDRISVHAFLAERAALEGLAFGGWGLDTAEDALLVGSLLSRSTPAHSPHATCVYVRGQGDASAYLAHPNRAADELAFARAIAPLRAAVEAKFGAPQEIDEAAYLAPFVVAARHAALFAQLTARAPGSGAIAVRDDALALLVADDPALATTPAPLAFQAVAGTLQPHLEVVAIEATQDYAHAARLPLDLPAHVRPAIVAVSVSQIQGAFGLALADANGALVGEARVEPLPTPVEVQLVWERPEAPNLIVRRLDAQGAARPNMRIDRVTLAFACDALANDKHQAQAALQALARAPRTVISPHLGGPPAGESEPLLQGAAEIDLGEVAWAYAYSMPLPKEAATDALRVELGPSGAVAFVLRVDTNWNAVGERLEVMATSRPTTLWVEPLRQGAAAHLVVQAGTAPAHNRVTLRGAFRYPPAGWPERAV